MADYKWKIEELKKEVKELEEEKELTMNQSRIDFIDEQIVNTKDSIKKLTKVVKTTLEDTIPFSELYL